jgi:hypothetical protein
MAKKKRGYEARLEKSALVLSHDPDLPAVCMKCGSHDTITRESRMFHWRPAWARFLVMCGIGLLVMLVTTQSASLEIPLCPKCTQRWSTARTAQIAAVLGIAIGFAVLMLVSLENKRIGLAVFLTMVAVYVALSFTFVRERMLRASTIDENEIGLLGVDAAATQEILVSARPPPPPPTSAS